MSEHSPYEEVELPKFESQIPEALLNDASDQERWVMNSISRITQTVDFLCTVIVHLSKNLKQTDNTAIIAAAKVQELENKLEKHDIRIQVLEEAKKTCERRKESTEKNGKLVHELRDFISLLAWRPFQLFMFILIIVGAFVGPTGLAAIWKFITGLL